MAWYHGLLLIDYYQGVLLLACFNFDTRTRSYTHYTVWDEIIHPFQNFNSAAVEVCELTSNSMTRTG